MSEACTTEPVVLNLMTTFGGMLTGCYLSQAIWGISTLQVFLYFKNFERDKAAVKILVTTLWLLDTANQVLLLKGLYRPLILQYGDFAGLVGNVIEIVVHTWIEVVVIFVVQLYFIRRIYMFGRKHRWVTPICIILVILASWQLIAIIVYWIWAYGKPILEQSRPRMVAINISIRSAAVVVDIVVALGMIYLLTRQRERARSKKTRKMIFRILIVTVNSGTWTALVALLVLIVVKVYPKDLTFCILEFTLCSLYFSTFMANLNARNYLRGDGTITTILGSDNSTGGGIVLGPVHNARANGSTTMMQTSTSSSVKITNEGTAYVEPEYVKEYMVDSKVSV